MKLRILSGVAMLLALAFATTSCDDDDDDFKIYTAKIITTIESTGISVTSTGATITSTIKDLSTQSTTAYAVGVAYATSDDSSSATKVTGSLGDDGETVTTELTGLTPDVTYYYWTYVTLQSNTTYYSESSSFVTTDGAIATADAASITEVSVKLSGTFTLEPSESDAVVKAFRISLDESTVADEGRLYESADTTNSYSLTIDGLVPGQTYYFVAYSTVNSDEYIGDVKSFTTETQSFEFVDLGLSVKWATCNVGATESTKAGGLFGFGDITLFETSTNAGDYASADIQGTENDIAYLINTDYLTPTQKQWEELVENTTQTFSTTGVTFTASNGNSIFLPFTGSREGEETTDEDSFGGYWSSDIDEAEGEHAIALGFSSEVTVSGASTYLGLAIRPVSASGATLAVDNSKILIGDLEGNGNFRIEIYNEYGSTASDPGIDTDFSFSSNLAVTWTISGLTDNFNDDAVGQYDAVMSYAAASWDPSYWGGTPKYDALVFGDGTYTNFVEVSYTAEGAVVWVIDVQNMATDITDLDAVSVTIDKIVIDQPSSSLYTTLDVDNDKVLFVNKDGNDQDGRIEIYNEYGDTASDPAIDTDDISFEGRMTVTFTISGIDGNTNGTYESYTAALSYSDPDWWPSWWGGSVGSADVTGDGTYTVYGDTKTSGEGLCEGAVVFTIELYDLWVDLVDTDAITVTIDEVTMQTAD